MKGNERTDLKNSEENAIDNAVKYLTAAGYKNIVAGRNPEEDCSPMRLTLWIIASSGS